MLNKQIIIAIFSTFLCLFAMQARAVVITFDENPAGPGNPLIASYSTGGFTFTSSHMHHMSTPSTCANGGCVDNGTQFLLEELSSPTISLTGGGAFTLNAFDGAEIFLNSDPANADSINVMGTLMGGGSVSTSFVLDGIRDGLGGLNDFQTFLLPNSFTNLVSVSFSGMLVSGALAGTAIDNIVINQTPEPSILMLFGFGLLGLLFIRRRNQI